MQDVLEYLSILNEEPADLYHAKAGASVLIFCAGVRHGERVSATICELANVPCGFITGDTPAKERDHLIDQFKRGHLKYSSRPGENVLDLFGGSGSTLIACEQTGRNAFLMEIDPAYSDVIVQRWAQFVQLDPVLQESGQTFAEAKESRHA